jgi:hypothetical protein
MALSKYIVMIVGKSKQKTHDEKEWANPVEPAKSTDDRDKEQLLRQYKEAKRRKDNLTEPNDSEKEN